VPDAPRALQCCSPRCNCPVTFSLATVCSEPVLRTWAFLHCWSFVQHPSPLLPVSVCVARQCSFGHGFGTFHKCDTLARPAVLVAVVCCKLISSGFAVPCSWYRWYRIWWQMYYHSPHLNESQCHTKMWRVIHFIHDPCPWCASRDFIWLSEGGRVGSAV